MVYQQMWQFENGKKILLVLVETTLPSLFDATKHDGAATSEAQVANPILPSFSNTTCFTSSLTNDSGYSAGTIASPHGRKQRGPRDTAQSETNDEKYHHHRDGTAANRPATPELQLPHELDDFLGAAGAEGSPQRPAAPAGSNQREARQQRSTSYLGMAPQYGGRRGEREEAGRVPTKYRFDGAKQAYVHENSSVLVVHNMPCAVDSTYEPSTAAVNVAKYYLAVNQKQATHSTY